MRDPSGDQAGSLPGPSRVTPPPSAAATSSRQAPKGPHTVTSSLVPSGDQRGGRLNAAKVRVRVTACSPANRNTASATPSVVRCQYARARPSGDQAVDAHDEEALGAADGGCPREGKALTVGRPGRGVVEAPA